MNRSMWARAAAVWLVLAACTNVTSPPPGRAGAGPRRGSRCSGGGGSGASWRRRNDRPRQANRDRLDQVQADVRPGRARCGSGARTARASPQGAAPAAAAEQEALARGR